MPVGEQISVKDAPAILEALRRTGQRRAALRLPAPWWYLAQIL